METTEKIICNKENPMKIEDKDKNYLHVDAEETGGETETNVEYKCPHCNLTFWVYLGS